MRFCSCLGGNRVQQDPDIKKTYLGPRGFEKTIESAHGVDLHAYFWPAEGEPRAVIQLLHGNNTYTEFDFLKFKAAGQPHDFDGSWVEEMNRRGYAVCGFDFQGFGRSSGTRAYIQRFDDIVEDALLFARHVRKANEGSFSRDGLPYFLAGYGLGGLVSVAISLRQPGWFSGMLLISPLLVLPSKIRESNRGIRIKGAIFPRAGVAKAADDEPTDWIKDACEQDPLVHSGKPRARTVVQLLEVTDRLASEEGDPPGLGCVTVPLLVLQADRDPVADIAGAQMLVDRAATHDKKLRSVPLTGHALVKDEQHSEKLLEEALSWMDEQCLTSRTKGLFRAAPDGHYVPPARQAKKVQQDDDGAGGAAAAAADGAEEESGEGLGDALPGVVNAGVYDEGPAANAAAARMAAAAAALAAEAEAGNTSQRSRVSNARSESAKEIDWEGGLVQERSPPSDDDLPLPPLDPAPRRSLEPLPPPQRRSLDLQDSGRPLDGRPSLSPYDPPAAKRDEQEEDQRPDPRVTSAEMEAERRFGGQPMGGDSSRSFMNAYGGGGGGGGRGPLLPGSNDDDNDPFAPRPPSPRPQAAAQEEGLAPRPPSALPPLGYSRFAPLPPIGFGGR